MILYLMRHGPAVDVGENGVKTDRERMLCAPGRKKTKMVAKWMKMAGIGIDMIFSSPLVRAMETARIVSENSCCSCKIEQESLLEPGMDYAKAVKWLAALDCTSVLLVGHMPDLSEFASFLIHGVPSSALHFKKAGLCRIAFEKKPGKGQGLLEWLVQPALVSTMLSEE